MLCYVLLSNRVYFHKSGPKQLGEEVHPTHEGGVLDV